MLQNNFILFEIFKVTLKEYAFIKAIKCQCMDAQIEIINKVSENNFIFDLLR